MTRDEAIAILRQDREGICTDMQCAMTMYRDYSGVDKCNQDCEEREAYDMAIEALHREEAEEKGYCHRIRPSAEAVPQGEWIVRGCELVCSVCGNSVSFSRTPKGWVLGRFCQTCGARMNKGGDTE